MAGPGTPIWYCELRYKMAQAIEMGLLLFYPFIHFHFRRVESAIHLFSILKMKKFIFQFLIFLAPFFLIAPFADIFLSRELKKSHVYADSEYPTWNDILYGKVNAEIIINGSSRAWVQINPTMIEDSLK